ncbi:MAG: hypothetical protein KatS3mg104_3027 [Phycisphaerae bacterium]|nr:MAG: hypothetical protein KatS3mg104_3027 [Phycisphaerae bacterium]
MKFIYNGEMPELSIDANDSRKIYLYYRKSGFVLECTLENEVRLPCNPNPKHGIDRFFYSFLLPADQPLEISSLVAIDIMPESNPKIRQILNAISSGGIDGIPPVGSADKIPIDDVYEGERWFMLAMDIDSDVVARFRAAVSDDRELSRFRKRLTLDQNLLGVFIFWEEQRTVKKLVRLLRRASRAA